MRIRAGTSGFSYDEWKGSFYPEDLAKDRMLAYYAERFDTVEINNTFYRMPKADMLEGWAEQTPAGFRFVLKASRRISHQKKLAGVEDDLSYLWKTSQALGEKLGPFLVQLPPWLKRDLDRLDGFLEALPDGMRVALEVRSSSWLDEEVYARLRDRGVALVVSDTDEGDEPPVLTTAPFGYARLRRTTYRDEDLEAWLGRFRAASWEDLWIYFKHEEEGTGPELARRFLEIAE
jgi:uncharacterized protein YecE (DUF72 family)